MTKKELIKKLNNGEIKVSVIDNSIMLMNLAHGVINYKVVDIIMEYSGNVVVIIAKDKKLKGCVKAVYFNTYEYFLKSFNIDYDQGFLNELEKNRKCLVE